MRLVNNRYLPMIMLALGVIFNTLIVMPRGMSMLSNSKVMLGAAMAFLILSAPLSVLSTGAVEGAVEDNFETYPTDTACANDDCTEAEADWATSTGERSYMAWNITNYDAIQADPTVAPVYQEVGPFDYDITYTREIIDFNKTAGTLTYSESKVYTCAEDTRTPCDTEVTTTNIPFQPQVVGATGLVIDNIMTATKAGFTTGMLAQDLESLSVGAPAAGVVSTNLSQTAAELQGAGMPSEMAVAAAPAALADAYWGGYAANFEAVAGVSYATANGLHEDFAANFTGDTEIDMNSAFNNKSLPSGENLSLTTALGVTMISGHCSANPTDATNATIRAGIWGYAGADIETTIARDWAMCAGVGAATFAALGGGDSTWMLDTTGTSVNASTRLSYLGITMDNTAAMAMLFGIPGDDVVTGLLEVDGTEFGVANFLQAEPAEDGTIAGLDAATYASVAAWAGGWMGSTSALPMILLGSENAGVMMTAEKFVNVTLGGEDPINGGYLQYSMNLGNPETGDRTWGTFPGPYLNAPEVVVSEEVAGNVLYGPLGVTTRTGATIFMYGELMGETPPINFTALATTGVPTQGTAMPWTNATVQALYPGLDSNAADALMFMVGEAIYKGTVADILQDSFFSDGPYKTQTVNNWLFGWFDPVSFAVSEDPTAPSAGWAKLETNQTYYGSISEDHPNGVSTGPATTYTICTGHNPNCDKGETLLEDGSPELPWHNTMMSMSTFGLIEVEYLNETTGGFLTGSGDKVDAGGYAITDVVCSGTGEVKNIPVDKCSASVDPTTRPITAKLIGSESLLDAMTPALPVYFGTEITLMSEELSGLIISGSSTSTFYLDMRAESERITPPTMDDLQPVFQIVQSSEIEDDDAEDMESAIVTNQNALSYWTNFDVPTDYVALLLYLGALTCLVLGVMALGNEEEEAKDYSSETAEAESSDAEEAETTE